MEYSIISKYSFHGLVATKLDIKNPSHPTGIEVPLTRLERTGLQNLSFVANVLTINCASMGQNRDA